MTTRESPTRERMLALGLTPTKLAKMAGVAVGSLEAVFRREKAGIDPEWGRLRPAEHKVFSTLDRLEAEAASAPVAVERVQAEGEVEWTLAMYQRLTPEHRDQVLLEIMRLFREEQT